MKVIVNEDRKIKVACMNKSGTQNENKATELELQVPTEFEDYNKKIVFVTDDGIVWDIVQDNTYKLTKAITKYKQVDFCIWLTKDDVDFRTETRPLRFYYNKDASDEITPEEISGVNTVVNILEEEITKVDSLETELRDLITDIQNKLDNGEFDGEDGYTPQKGVDYFTEQDIEEIEGDILNEVYTKEQTDTLLDEKADIEDIPDVSSFITKDVNDLTNYTLKTNTGSLIDLEINDTTYVVTLKLKNQDGTIISTDTIDLPLESVVVSGKYDNTTKKVILTLENGSEVDFSVADLVAGLQTEITSQNKLASDLVDDTNSGNKFVTTTEKQTWNNKLDESDLTDYVKNTDYATDSKGGTIRTGWYNMGITSGHPMALTTQYSNYSNLDPASFISKGTLENVIAGKQLINQTQLEESQATQDEQIEALQTENERLKATLPTTTGEGQDITLDKTAELEFVKPPLPMGNSEQVQYSGENLFNKNTNVRGNYNCSYTFNNGIYTIINTDTSKNFSFTLDLNLPAGSYTLNSNSYLSATTQMVNQSNVSITNLSANYNCVQFTTQEDIYGIRFNWGATSQPVTLDLNSLQIVNGTYTSSTMPKYEPYTGGTASPNPDYPQEITNVTGDVEVKVQNKNLLPILPAQSKTLSGITLTSNGDGSYSVKGTSTQSGTILFDINNVKLPNNTIYLHIRNNITAGIGMQIQTSKGTTSPSFSTLNRIYNSPIFTDAIITKIGFYFPENITIDTTFIPSLELSNNISDYVEHKEQVLPLTLGNIELCKIGDYQDYFYKESNKWYLHKEIGKYTIPNNIGGYNSGSNWYYIGIGQFSNIKTNSGTEILCNYLQNINLALDANINKSGIYNIGTHIVLRNIDLSSTSDYQTWISNNKILYSLLETPTDTEITDTTLISQLEAINNALSYEEQTNISGSSSGSNPIFDVEAYQSTKLILENLESRLTLVEG